MVGIPIWEKANLNFEEAAEYFNIGINTLRSLAKDERFYPCFLSIGNRKLIKRKVFEEHLETVMVL